MQINRNSIKKNEYNNKDNLRWFYNLEEWEKKILLKIKIHLEIIIFKDI